MEMSATYELFISHAKADQQWVYGYLLPELGLSPKQVITTSQFQPGKSIVAEFERAIKASRYVILVFTPAYIADDWADFSEQLATYAVVASQRNRLIPIKLEEVSIPLRIEFRVSLDFRLATDWATETTRLRDLLLLPEPTTETIPCPYPGLRPFTTENASVFFGRDDEINDMLRRLRYQHFIAIIGASGSGKSSLTYAGILSQLPQSSFFTKGYWLVRDMRPGDQPTERLSTLLEGELTTDPSTLICDLLDKNKPSERLLLVIDQFEELFNLASRDEQDKFTTALQNLRRHPDCCILLCMRAAFYQDLMGSRLWPIDASERLELVPLRDESLAKAIEKPASGVGVFLEPKLLDRLLSDAANEPGVLPLMQEAMVLLWEKRSNKLITFQSYKQLGKSGLAVAMAAKADATYASLLPEQQLIARRIFLRLVQFGEGRPDTRRQQPVSELHSTDDNPTEFTTCINHLVNNRLLTFNAEENSKNPNVDIAHESLIDGWPKLQGWIRERRETEQVRRRLEQKAAEWVRLGRSNGGLLDATELLEATSWLNSPDAKDLGFSDDVQALVGVSQRELDAIKEAKEAAREKEIKDIRQRNYIISTIAVFAIAAFIYAVIELNIAQSRQLAAQALTYIDVQLDRALFLSSKAYNKDNNIDTRGSLLSTLGQSPHLRKFLHSHSAFAWNVKISPNSKIFVSGHADGTIVFWDLINERPLTKPLLGHSKAVNVVEFSPDGKTVASASADGTIVLWDVLTRKSIDTLVDKNNNIAALAYSHNGNLLASGGTDKQITLWNAVTHQFIDSLSAHESTINCIAFSPDGQLITSGDSDQKIIFWNTKTRKPIGDPLDEHYGSVYALAFSPDGTLLASGSGGDTDKNLIIWDVPSRRSLEYAFLGHTESVMGLKFSPTGDTLFSCGADRKIIQWNMNNYEQLGNPLTGHRDQINSVDITQDGKTLISSGWDNNIILWDLPNPNLLGEKLFQSPFAIQSIRFDSDQKHMLTGDQHGTLTFNDLDQKPTISFSTQTTMYPNCLALSSDRKILASGQSDGTLTLWNIASQQPVCPAVKLHTESISCIAFNKENTLVATGSDDGTVKLWNVATQKSTGLKLRAHRGDVNSLTFSPDGLTLAVCYDRCTVVLYNTKTWKRIRSTVLIDTDSVCTAYAKSASFNPSGEILAIGDDSQNNRLRLWDINREKFTLLESKKGINVLSFNPNGNQIVSGGYDGTLKFWNLPSKYPKEIKSTQGTIYGLSYSPTSNRLAVASKSKTVRIYDAKTGKLTDTLAGHKEAITDVLFINDSTLASASNDKSIIIWNVLSHKPIGKPLKSKNSIINCLALSPKGGTVVLGDDQGVLTFWNTFDKRYTKSLKVDKKAVNYLDISPNGRLLATCGADTVIKLWDISTYKLITTLPKIHRAGIACVRFSPDGKLLASGGSDRLIILWNLNDYSAIVLPKNHSKEIKRIAFSPDGKLLASSASDRMIFLWNISKRQPVGPALMGHANGIWSLAFSPNGKLLASGGDDKKINLWNVATHDRFGSALTTSDQVWALTFSQNNEFLFSGERNGYVTRWDLDPKKWAEKAKKIANIQED
ncbi:TIR domain-containing protein [Spirosoma sp. HMF4905]|uniref:TIR domain-containing protein n=1 Tax=Spirosoma arboris TaxID=2682092 RepID=A0A7K1SK99_9BACT|nr:TIR domain-containing protein [Spirosoma arboris]MVM34153.1 TIR domain-containing protein [Spirosoma arboris]